MRFTSVFTIEGSPSLRYTASFDVLPVVGAGATPLQAAIDFLDKIEPWMDSAEGLRWVEETPEGHALVAQLTVDGGPCMFCNGLGQVRVAGEGEGEAFAPCGECLGAPPLCD